MTNPGAAAQDAVLAAVMAGVDVFDLAQPLFDGMPCSPSHPGFKMALARRHGDVVRADGGSSANEIIVTGGHVGTHVDALAHVSHQGKMYGDVDCAKVQSGGGFRTHGVDAIPPMVCRGVFLDVAARQGVRSLPAGYGITAEDLADAAKLADALPTPGSVCLINTGWSRWWDDPVRYLGAETGVPGITPEAAQWLAAHQITAAGTDTTAFEQIHPGQGHAIMPVHRILVVDHGIHIVEHLRLTELAAQGIAEFIFILAPLKIIGATGSPVRPLGVVSRRNAST